MPVTPPTVHMPGGSVAPDPRGAGLMGLFLGLVFGGVALWIGVVLLVVTLLWWLREAIRDYDQPWRRSSAPGRRAQHAGPPPGVHMPGPSIRPFLGALGSAALFAGLVFGGWVLVLGGRVPRLDAARLADRLHRGVPQGRGGRPHRPPREHPGATRCRRAALQVFAVLFVVLGMWQFGIFPPTTPATAGRRRRLRVPRRAGAPPGSIPIIAVGLAFDERELTVPGRCALHDLPDQRGHAEHAARRRDQRCGRRGRSRQVPPTPGGQSMAYQYDAASGRRLHLHLLDPSDRPDDRDPQGPVAGDRSRRSSSTGDVGLVLLGLAAAALATFALVQLRAALDQANASPGASEPGLLDRRQPAPVIIGNDARRGGRSRWPSCAGGR